GAAHHLERGYHHDCARRLWEAPSPLYRAENRAYVGTSGGVHLPPEDQGVSAPTCVPGPPAPQPAGLSVQEVRPPLQYSCKIVRRRVDLSRLWLRTRHAWPDRR